MVWNPAKPANTGAILTEFSGARDNWTAIDNALDMEDDGCNRIKLLETTDPADAAGTGFVYVKKDTDDTELYYRDRHAATSNIVKVTEDGFLRTFIKGFIYCNALGVVQGTPYNMTVAHPSTGVYTYTFVNALPDANYVVTSSVDEVSAGVRRNRVINVINRATTGFQAVLLQGDNSLQNSPISLCVMHYS